MRYFPNPSLSAQRPSADPMLDAGAGAQVAELVASVFDYRPTPLVSLPTLAAQAGVAQLHMKDEGARLGLRSFKALGGAYAVVKLVCARAAEVLGRQVRLDELPRPASGSLDFDAAATDHAGSPDFHRVAAQMTFACATDGNHGQSVAAGARLVGAQAVIFVHEGVSERRRAAIARFGAELRVVAGTYDDAVEAALQQARQAGWTLLSDTSWPGYVGVPKWVMQGYTLMTHELAGQLDEAPTHVFLQAGVGGFAAAIAVSLPGSFAGALPRTVVVEPERAACLFASAGAGAAVKVDAGQPTLMSMLECFEPSLLAWELLAPTVAGFMTIEDEDAVAAMRLLAYPVFPRETVVAGESGAAGLAGFLAASRNPAVREALGLGPASRVLLFNTESATDEDRYTALVGTPPAQIAQHTAGFRHTALQDEKATPA